MTRELAKAVRIINGYTPNLRVKLDANRDNPTIYQKCIESVLLDRAMNIYGISKYEKICGTGAGWDAMTPDERMKLLHFIGWEAYCACQCIFE